MSQSNRIVLAVALDSLSLSAFHWIRDDPIGLCTKDLELDIVHGITSNKDIARGLEILTSWEKVAKKELKDRFVIKTKLIRDEQGVGHGIKVFCNQNKARLLVVTSSRKSSFKRHLLGSVSEYLQHHCQCPVMVIKKDRSEIYDEKFLAKPAHVALAIDRSVHSAHAVDWFLSNATLPKQSILVLLHVVRKPSEKPDARTFLAGFKPKCVESKKNFTMKSGLVYFKGKKPSESIVKYCEDYRVDLIIVASKMLGTVARQLQGSICDDCVHQADCDVLIWKDERTRRLSLMSDAVQSKAREEEPQELDIAATEVDDGYQRLAPLDDL